MHTRKLQKDASPEVWIRLPRNRRPQEWYDIEEPVVLVEVHLHGDPMAGLLWERKLEDILPKKAEEKCTAGNACYIQRSKQICRKCKWAT